MNDCYFYLLLTILSTAMCSLSENIYDYYNVSQGKITIPSMDDGEEFSLTDVSYGIDELVCNRLFLCKSDHQSYTTSSIGENHL